MCARYRQTHALSAVAQQLGVPMGIFADWGASAAWGGSAALGDSPRFNIRISQRVLMMRSKGGHRELAEAEWGFLAPWDRKKRIFNAAAETAAVKPTFREAFHSRRCLLPADGFYEWPKKQPTLIRFDDDRVFCFAGLWTDETVTMLTCAPNDFMRPIHHRMPVILPASHYDGWLDAKTAEAELGRMLLPVAWPGMRADAIAKLPSDI